MNGGSTFVDPIGHNYTTVGTFRTKDSTDRLSKALVGERELIKVVCYYSSSNGSSWDGNL